MTYRHAERETPREQITLGYWEPGNPEAVYTDLKGQPISREAADALGIRLWRCTTSSFARREQPRRWATRLHGNPTRCYTFDGKIMNCVYAIEVADYVVYEAGWKPEEAAEKAAEKRDASAALDALPDRDSAPLASPKAAAVTALVSEKERERKVYIEALCALPEAQGKPAAVAKLADLYGNERVMPLWRAASILQGLPSEDPRARAKADRESEAALMSAAKDRVTALQYTYDDADLSESKRLAYGLRIKSLDPRRPFVQCLRESGADISKLKRAA
jgi:hypothetical protein